MLVDLLLTPFVLLAAVLFLLSAIFSLGAGFFALARLCRWVASHLPAEVQGGVIEDVIYRVGNSMAFNHPLAGTIEKSLYVGAVGGLLLFGSQIAMFVAYGAVFTAVVCLVQSLRGRGLSSLFDGDEAEVGLAR